MLVPTIITDGLFVLTVAGCAGAVIAAIGAAFPAGAVRQRASTIAAGAVVGWLFLLAMLAEAGVLVPGPGYPPPPLFVALLGMASLLALVFSPLGTRIADAVSPIAIVGFQGFRVAVEIVLFFLVADGRMPVQMSFEGRNFDVVTGITAIAWAVWMARQSPLAPRLLVAWNLMGLMFLAVVVAIAAMSSPGPLRQFTNEPAITLPASAPYVWLPGFLVPLALAGHALSLRQVWRHSTTPKAPA